MGFREKLKNKEIQLFPIGKDGYRIYGQTFDIKDELKEAGATWNTERKSFEISMENFAKLAPDIRDFVFKSVLAEKTNSMKRISSAIMDESIKLYLKDGNYRVYGKTKEIYKDLLNTFFKFVDGKYQLSEEMFTREFSDEVKVKVDSMQNSNDEISNEEME